MLDHIQRLFNNFVLVTTKKILNEIAYDFTSLQTIDLLKSFAVSINDTATSSVLEIETIIKAHLRSNMIDAIVFAQMQFKFYYDRKHQSIYLDVDDWVLLRLYRDYNISSVKSKKLNQQYVESFQITKKIERLVYRLDIFEHWRIHSIFTIAQLKSSSSSWSNSFNRSRSTHSNSVFVEEDIKQIKSFELEKIIN